MWRGWTSCSWCQCERSFKAVYLGHLIRASPPNGSARVQRPVRNDIAGTLGRMQPRCQQYRGGSPRSRTTSAPSCVGWAQRSCACAQPSPAGSPSIPTRPCACPCSLATTSKTLPAISARVNGNFGSGIWACGLHNHTRAPCDSKATPSGGPEKVQR